MDTDLVYIRLVPEKKGLILKHSEYEITSDKFNTTVVRRYNDFVTFYNLLLTKFPYRMLPRLPPKQIMLDSLLEERRRGLKRWLLIICQHPIISLGTMLQTFLTDKSADHLEHLRDVFSNELDEFSKLSKTELPLKDQGQLAASREMMRTMLFNVTRFKKIIEQQAARLHALSVDMNEMSMILGSIEASNRCIEQGTFTVMVAGLQGVTSASIKSSTTQSNLIIEKINLLLDVLVAHSDLCERIDKGVVSEHQRALSKMLNINKQKIRGVIRGSAAENVNALHEQEVVQTTVVGTLERRTAFSIYCVYQETSLAQNYLKILPSILLSFFYEQKCHSNETLKCWETILASATSKLEQ